jgi:hypothetical protein
MRRLRGDDNLLKHATDYYKELFGHGAGNAFALNSELWQPNEKFNESDNNEITKPFLEKEIKDALDQMEKNKAPGPDGIPIEFFQHSWEIIKRRHH